MGVVYDYTDSQSCVNARLYWSDTEGLCFSTYNAYLAYVAAQGGTTPGGGDDSGVGPDSPEYTIDLEENNLDYGYTHGVAGAVLDAFDIEYKSKTNETSGALPGLDIKSQDAMGVIKGSLTEAYAGRLYDLPVDIAVDPLDGKVEFFEIGAFDGNITDIYQVVNTDSYLQRVAGAMVHGKKPLPYRRVENRLNMLANSVVYNMTLYNTDCVLFEEYDLEATIVYHDPLYIYDSLWYSSGWGSLRGHIHAFSGPDDDTMSVHFSKNSIVPRHLSTGFPTGVDVVRPDDADVVPQSAAEARCVYSAIDTSTANTLFVQPPQGVTQRNTRQGYMPTFYRLADIIIVGRNLLGFKENPADCTGNPSADTGFASTAEFASDITALRLTQGKHYVVKNEEDGAKVVFVSNIPGYQTYGLDTQFYDLKRQVMQLGDVVPLDIGFAMKAEATIATLELLLPSITIRSRVNAGAESAANKVRYYVSNLVIYDEMPPVALNGTLVDLTDMQPHRALSNPSDFVTNLDEAIESMDQGRGMQIQLGTLGEPDCEYLSAKLYELMQDDDGIQTEYMCGPLCQPVLGGRGRNGGIINTISYKYQDEASYLVYVTEGSALASGFSGAGQETQLKTVDLTLEGTVINKPSGGTVSVYVDKFGTYKCLITAAMHIRPGDRVAVTLFNYPAETL